MEVRGYCGKYIYIYTGEVGSGRIITSWIPLPVLFPELAVQKCWRKDPWAFPAKASGWGGSSPNSKRLSAAAPYHAAPGKVRWCWLQLVILGGKWILPGLISSLTTRPEKNSLFGVESMMTPQSLPRMFSLGIPLTTTHPLLVRMATQVFNLNSAFKFFYSPFLNISFHPFWLLSNCWRSRV